jgi:hypothetical protein
MLTYQQIREFTAYLFHPVLRAFREGDRVQFKGNVGTIFRVTAVTQEYATDKYNKASFWRPCSKLHISIRYDVAGATAGVRIDPLVGDARLRHLAE